MSARRGNAVAELELHRGRARARDPRGRAESTPQGRAVSRAWSAWCFLCVAALALAYAAFTGAALLILGEISLVDLRRSLWRAFGVLGEPSA